VAEVNPTRFRLEPLGPGVWAALGRREAGVTSNAGIVDLGNVTLIVDSFLTPQAAEELRTASRVLTGRDPSALVNTHWHFDHCLGNGAFRDCEIYATEETRERILNVGPQFLPTVRGDVGTAQIRRLESAAEAEPRPLFREELESEVAARRDLYERSRMLQVIAPNQVYHTRLNLPARESAWIVEVRGHTGSDSMVFVPDAEVLFTGDIVVSGIHPNVATGNVEQWIGALGAVRKIAPERLVPGHGPPVDLSSIPPVEEYLTSLRQRARDGASGPIPERLASWLSPSLYEANERALRAHPDGARSSASR
jgi:cyclase